MESNDTLVRCIFRNQDDEKLNECQFHLLTNQLSIGGKEPGQKNSGTYMNECEWIWLLYALKGNEFEFKLSQSSLNKLTIELEEDTYHSFLVPTLSADQAVSIDLNWNRNYESTIISLDDILNENEDLFEKLQLPATDYDDEINEEYDKDSCSLNPIPDRPIRISPKIIIKMPTESLDSICGSSSEVEEIMSHQNVNKLNVAIPSKQSSSDPISSSSDRILSDIPAKVAELPEEDEVFACKETEDGLIDIDKLLLGMAMDSEKQNTEHVTVSSTITEIPKARPNVIVAKIQALFGFGFRPSHSDTVGYGREQDTVKNENLNSSDGNNKDNIAESGEELNTGTVTTSPTHIVNEPPKITEELKSDEGTKNNEEIFEHDIMKNTESEFENNNKKNNTDEGQILVKHDLQNQDGSFTMTNSLHLHDKDNVSNLDVTANNCEINLESDTHLHVDVTSIKMQSDENNESLLDTGSAINIQEKGSTNHGVHIESVGGLNFDTVKAMSTDIFIEQPKTNEENECVKESRNNEKNVEQKFLKDGENEFNEDNIEECNEQMKNRFDTSEIPVIVQNDLQYLQPNFSNSDIFFDNSLDLDDKNSVSNLDVTSGNYEENLEFDTHMKVDVTPMKIHSEIYNQSDENNESLLDTCSTNNIKETCSEIQDVHIDTNGGLHFDTIKATILSDIIIEQPKTNEENENVEECKNNEKDVEQEFSKDGKEKFEDNIVKCNEQIKNCSDLSEVNILIHQDLQNPNDYFNHSDNFVELNVKEAIKKTNSLDFLDKNEISEVDITADKLGKSVESNIHLLNDNPFEIDLPSIKTHSDLRNIQSNEKNESLLDNFANNIIEKSSKNQVAIVENSTNDCEIKETLNLISNVHNEIAENLNKTIIFENCDIMKNDTEHSILNLSEDVYLNNISSYCEIKPALSYEDENLYVKNKITETSVEIVDRNNTLDLTLNSSYSKNNETIIIFEKSETNPEIELKIVEQVPDNCTHQMFDDYISSENIDSKNKNCKPDEIHSIKTIDDNIDFNIVSNTLTTTNKISDVNYKSDIENYNNSVFHDPIESRNLDTVIESITEIENCTSERSNSIHDTFLNLNIQTEIIINELMEECDPVFPMKDYDKLRIPCQNADNESMSNYPYNQSLDAESNESSIVTSLSKESIEYILNDTSYEIAIEPKSVELELSTLNNLSKENSVLTIPLLQVTNERSGNEEILIASALPNSDNTLSILVVSSYSPNNNVNYQVDGEKSDSAQELSFNKDSIENISDNHINLILPSCVNNSDSQLIDIKECNQNILLNTSGVTNKFLSMETSISSNKDSAVVCDSDSQSGNAPTILDDSFEEFIYNHPMTTSQTVDSLFLSTRSSNKQTVSDNEKIDYPTNINSHDTIYADELNPQSTSIESINKSKLYPQECSLKIPQKQNLNLPLIKNEVSDVKKHENETWKNIQRHSLVNDDDLFPDSVTPTKADSKLRMGDCVYDIPYIDDEPYGYYESPTNNDYLRKRLMLKARLADCDECTLSSELELDLSIRQEIITPLTARKQKRGNKLFRCCSCFSRYQR